MTSDRTLTRLDTLGRALREVSALLRATEVQAALEGLSAEPPRDAPHREAAERVRAAARAARGELDAMVEGLRGR